MDRIESVIANQTKVEVGVKNLEAKTTNLRLEKIKMPREYPRFRKDFEVQVMRLTLCIPASARGHWRS